MTLQEWFGRRGGTANPTGRPVVLFPDTFNNYVHTDVGVACVEAIEAAGWRVIMPARRVCCGRPLYDYGFLDAAGRYLRRMLPHDDDDAARLARNAFHFGEFFTTFGVEAPRIEGSALLWGHCHHRATGGTSPEQRLLEETGLSVTEIKGGCCGLAGSWGFEKGTYAISMDCGEQALLPAVRDAPDETLVVDGRAVLTRAVLTRAVPAQAGRQAREGP